jgi:hypothetical protein
MDKNHKLALYVSYYLSRFNDEGLTNLGYSTWNEAYSDIADKLQVNKHSVKNWRDEFDPIHGHRAGWYQRPMIASRAKVCQALENLDEQSVREIVVDILTGKIKEDADQEKQLLSIPSVEQEESSPKQFILRAPTGRKAEKYFIEYFEKNKKPINGDLIDCRDLGVGYDFRIEADDKNYFVEVKGISDFSGGVLFTNKEWSTARNEGDSYFLCIVSNLNEKIEINFIQNPFEKLNAKKNIYTSIQINWSVTANQLAEIND